MDTRTRLAIKEVIRRQTNQRVLADHIGMSRENLTTMLNTPSDWHYRWGDVLDALDGVEIVVMCNGEVVEPDEIDLMKAARKEKKKDVE